MSRAPKTARRITAADVERWLDTLADVMANAGPRAHLAVPLWKRLERELERLRDARKPSSPRRSDDPWIERQGEAK